MGLTLTQAQKMTIKLNKRQLIAAEMLGMGYRPSSVAEKLGVSRETVSRWQQNESFDAAKQKSYLNTLHDITNETTLIISTANQALLAALRDNSVSSTSRANIAVRYLSCVGHQNTVYQKLSESAYKLSNSEEEDMRAFKWIGDILDCIADLKASSRVVTDAEYREKIEKLFGTARGKSGHTLQSKYIPTNIVGTTHTQPPKIKERH